MLTLETGQTFRGVAETATIVTLTLYGDESGSETDNDFKVLYQGLLPSAITTLYTTPAAHATLIRSIHVRNNHPTLTKWVEMYVGGTATQNSIARLTIPPNGMAIYDGRWAVYDVNGEISMVGSPGASGVNGSTWYEGTGAPAGGTGVDGDFYLNDATGDVYQKSSGTWGVVANILGPQGDGFTDGDKGDITVGGGATTLTIDNDAVTYAKMQNVSATSRILGRKTAGAGDPEELTIYDAMAMAQGASFPVSPATNQQFFRTDLGMQFYYDGTRWLSTQMFTVSLWQGDGLQPFSATTNNYPRGALIVPSALNNVWLVDLQVAFRIQGGGSALSASHKWVITFVRQPAGTTFATVNIDSGASTTWRSAEVSLGVLWNTDLAMEATSTKTGTPGTLYLIPSVRFRYVAA